MPNFGASLQILKVEIGGDVQSTDGTEASHMHTPDDENYHRGYEWWLMKEAKKRNPNLKLYGLSWGFPGWLGFGDTGSPYVNETATADYTIRWIQGAKCVHNLTIDYVGIWNERSYKLSYIMTLHRMLHAAGLTSTQIVATDDFGWAIASAMLGDKAMTQAVDCIGSHYPGTKSSGKARRTGKPLWASEDFSTHNGHSGGGCWARILNQNYVNGYMTSTISWNLITSYYYSLPFYRDALMTASEPWSGHYNVESPIWVSAHTTQFTQPGWRYLRHGNGCDHLEGGGSFVTLVSPDKHDLSMVLETMTHNHSLCIRPGLQPYTVQLQTATFRLAGSFKHVAELKVWVSKLDPASGKPVMFMERSPIKAEEGLFSLELGLDEVYTLSTVSTANKGHYPPPPPPKPFPLPYFDDFQNYQVSQEPFNLSPQVGSFEVVEEEPSNNVLRQTVLQHPVNWCQAEHANKTITIIGSANWTDVSVRVDFALNTTANSSDGVFLGAQAAPFGCATSTATGVFFALYPASRIYVLSQNFAMTDVIRRGELPLSTKKWKTAQLTIQGDTVEIYYNGQLLSRTGNPQRSLHGFVALGTTSWGTADFDNLAIMPVEKQHALFFQPQLHS